MDNTEPPKKKNEPVDPIQGEGERSPPPLPDLGVVVDNDDENDPDFKPTFLETLPEDDIISLADAMLFSLYGVLIRPTRCITVIYETREPKKG